MSDKNQKVVFFGITILFIILFLYFDYKNIQNETKKFSPLKINYEDSLYLNLESIVRDDYLKIIIVNDSLSWCAGYSSFYNIEKKEDDFYTNYLNFKILSKKANSDTLLTIDRNRNLRYYNIRSGPCSEEGKNGW